MNVVIPREITPGERRVALVPDLVGRLLKSGNSVVVEAGAGERAGFADTAYETAGARIAHGSSAVFRDADVVLRVQRPSWNEALEAHEIDCIPPSALLVGLMKPHSDTKTIGRLAERGITTMAMELVPRISRAQTMDALSSQATVAGYKAVLLAANELPKFFPLLMTAAGTVRPSTVFVLGAGVAGLQAIATARRLGAVVEAFDTRPAVKEQVKSLGAKFVELELGHQDAEDAGGYANALSADHLRREMTLIADHVAKADIVITTAQIPGRPAPVLITQEMVQAMRAGSVIVDLAAESGGNCEASKPGQSVTFANVRILAPLNLPSEVATHASQLYARNVVSLLEHLAPLGTPALDLADEITRAVCVTHKGQVLHAPTRERLGLPQLGATS